MKQTQNSQHEKEKIKEMYAQRIYDYRCSIFNFLRDMWGLYPQTIKPEYKKQWDEVCLSTWDNWERLKPAVKPEWFGDWNEKTQQWDWYDFQKGKHVTWQQSLLFMGIDKANNGDASKHISVVSGHGIGKAHPLTMVLDTPQGVRVWGDIRPGDKLFGSNGSPTKVVATKLYESIPMYRVTFDDRTYCDVSSGHLWNVRGRQERRNGKNTWRTMETIEIAKQVKRLNGSGMARQWEIPQQQSVSYPTKHVPIEPYLVGVMLGDGTRLKPCFTSNDSEVVDHIESLGYKTSFVTKKGTNARHYHVSGIQAHLRSLGMFEPYAHEKKVPLQYKQNNEHVRAETLRGLLDTDGEVGKEGSVCFSSTSRQLADDVVWLARSLGGKATIQPAVKKPFYKNKYGVRVDGLPCYRVTLCMPQEFVCFYIKRKQQRISSSIQNRYRTRWIESIEPIGSAPGMCVTVENSDGLYLANDFIVTHNSMSCSIITLWFLYCYYGAQVPVTAPTSHQMKDVLWKEMSIWIKKMPQEVQPLYQWSSDYVRMAHDPESWFARARTSTKENTEAIAGVHADHVCLVVDEASGIPEQVYTAAEGALTSGNVLVVLISNGTRTTGYFYDTHHKRKHDWQTFQFDGEHSPIVDREYVEMQEKRHGRGTDEFRIRVSGGFPTEDAMDDSGYLQLIASNKIILVPKIGDTLFVGRRILGVDPSGEGKDETTFVVRDHFHAEVVHCERTSNPRMIAERILTFMARYKIQDMDVVVGSLGVGTDVGKEVALASLGKFNIYTVLEGNQPSYEEQYNALFFRRMDDEMDEHKVDLYLNLRSLMHFRARKWLIRGGTIIDSNIENSEFVNEIISNKYKRSLQGNKIQMMPKSEMSKLRIKSPNKSDAFCLTFLRDLDPSHSQSIEEIEAIEEDERRIIDRFAVI